jgi:hypothetical protein
MDEMLVFPAVTLAQVAALLGTTAFATTVNHHGAQHLPSLSAVSARTSFPSSVSAPTTIIDHIDTPAEESTAWGDSVYDDPGELHRVYYQNIDGMKNQDDIMGLYVSSMAQFQPARFAGLILV